MSAIATGPVMTTEEMLALPENGTERDLIRGELREKPVSRRNRRHGRTQANTARFLGNWLIHQRDPRGELLGGNTAFRLRRNPDSTVGIDLAYISAALAEQTPENARFIEGVPVLAVEILSPSNTQEEVMEKVTLYLEVGVALVWVIEPVFRTVTVYRPGKDPELFNAEQELVGDPHLPGFRVAVADLFRR